MDEPLLVGVAVALAAAGLYLMWRVVCWLDPNDDLMDVLGPTDADDRNGW